MSFLRGIQQKKHSRYGRVDARGVWRDDNMSWPGGNGPTYQVLHPKTGKPCVIPDGGWRYATSEKMKEMIAAGVVEFREDDTEPPIRKTYLVRTALDDDEPEDNEDIGIQVAGSYFYRSALQASRVLYGIFAKKVFENPKDHSVLMRWIRYCTTDDSNAIVLDSFAGSGTTAHAVLALNKQDGGNRRFLLIESEDYVDSITAERIRRVSKGVFASKDVELQAGLGGTFSYFKLGRPMQMSAILEGKTLPDFESLARYVFFTATGEEFDAKKIDRKTGFIGESRHHDVFLFYTEDAEKLKQLALTLDAARALPSISGKAKLVFAPTKYLDESFLDRLKIKFCQLPFQIYKALDA